MQNTLKVEGLAELVSFDKSASVCTGYKINADFVGMIPVKTK